MGAEADAADIQSFAEHVLRKESRKSSRFTSFTTETKVAKGFHPAADFRYVSKADMEVLRDLEARGIIKIHTPDSVYEAMRAGPRKISKEATAVRDTMRRNAEILIEGQIPEGVLQGLKSEDVDMQEHTSLVAAGNTYNPCLLILKRKGYHLSAEESGERLLWNATKEDHSFTGYSPPELLGIVVLWETLGHNWNQQQPDLIGELTV